MLRPHFLRWISLVLAGALVFSACDLLGESNSGEAAPETTGVFVANGGNFSDQNGTITVYDPGSGQASTPAALQLNAFVHSLELRDDRLYAQLNTGFRSGHVNVIDADTYSVTAQSDSLGAARYVALPENDTAHAYVSTLNGTVHRFDVDTGDASRGAAQVGASAADLIATSEKVFTTVPDSSLALGDTLVNNGSTLAVFDVGSPETVRTIDLSCDGPSSIAQDDEGELVVVCTGRTTFNEDFSSVVRRTNGSVVFVDPTSESVVDRLSVDRQFGSLTGTQIAHYDPASEFLHGVSSSTGKIVRVDTDANTISQTIDVPSDSSLTGIAAVAYDGTTQRVYVARGDVQKPFQTAGTVVVLDASNTETDRFPVGPAPSHIVIRRELP